MDQEILALFASNADEYDGVRNRALYHLDDQDLLISIFTDAHKKAKLALRRTVFAKLSDESLERLRPQSDDPAVLMSARVRLGYTSWEQGID